MFNCSHRQGGRSGGPYFFQKHWRNSPAVLPEPGKEEIFAGAAQKSYLLWSGLAKTYHLPWLQVGTLEVAVEGSQVPTLNQYKDWALKNGMDESEVEVLDTSGVKEKEPLVRSMGAIHSKTDTAVNYGDFTKCVFDLAGMNGVEFMGCQELVHVVEDSSGKVRIDLRKKSGETSKVSCSYMINAAGGNSIDIAHKLGVGKQYT